MDRVIIGGATIRNGGTGAVHPLTLADRTLADRTLADRTLADQKLADQKLADQKPADQKPADRTGVRRDRIARMTNGVTAGKLMTASGTLQSVLDLRLLATVRTAAITAASMRTVEEEATARGNASVLGTMKRSALRDDPPVA